MHVDVEQFGSLARVAQPEGEMLAMSIIALVSTAGVAFYVRLLVALCRERKSLRRIYGYCVRLDCDETKARELITTRILKNRNSEPIRN